MEDQIFNNDVIFMKSLIGRTVSIQTIDNRHHQGVVFVIDPIYKTVVLLHKEDKSKLEFILHHAIKSFDLSSDEVDNDFLCNNQNNGTCTEDSSEKKLKLMKWLKHMYIDVREEGEFLKVEDHVKIGPPYGREDCICDNTIVLERIRIVIDLMPPDFE